MRVRRVNVSLASSLVCPRITSWAKNEPVSKVTLQLSTAARSLDSHDTSTKRVHLWCGSGLRVSVPCMVRVVRHAIGSETDLPSPDSSLAAGAPPGVGSDALLTALGTLAAAADGGPPIVEGTAEGATVGSSGTINHCGRR